MRVRNIAAGVAVAALLGTGAGVAGASGGGHQGRHHLRAEIARVEAIAKAGKLPASYKCSNASKDLARISKAESWINAYLPKAEAREAADLLAGKKRAAHVLARRIAAAEQFDSALVTVGSLINAACSSAS